MSYFYAFHLFKFVYTVEIINYVAIRWISQYERASKSKPDRDRFVKHPLEDTRNGHWGDEDENEYEDECDEYSQYNEIATWHPTCIIYKINDMKIEFDATKNVEYNLEKQKKF